MDAVDFSTFESKMESTIEALGREFSRIRSGRATPALVDKVLVEAYGSEMPLSQVATISVPEARTLVIQPYDQSVIGNIERSLHKANLGVAPNNDGKVIRLNMPPLTEERRKDFVKMVKVKAEDAKVSLRQARRDALEEIKGNKLPEDAEKRAQDNVQKLTEKFTQKIDKATEAKEKEIMEV